MDGITMGVEEELLIVDRASGALVPRSDELVPLVRERLGDQVSAELNRCQIETATRIHRDLAGVRAELCDLRRVLDETAAEIGCAVRALGTHPFSSWQDQEVEADRPRFAAMADQYRRLADQQVICGCHVHVGIDDPDLAVAVMTRIRPWLPVLAALAANSPYWEGEDTGYDSYRLEVWTRWPTSGFPPRLPDRPAYERLVHQLEDAAAIEDATHLYWHARPSERYPTLELRVTDVGYAVDDAVAIAGLARALVRGGLRAEREGSPASPATPELLDAALWRAARYGLGEELVSPVDLTPRPAATVVDELLEAVGPELDELGDREEVTALVRGIVADGNGATRQRREGD
jgi:carboxylate-amine ligase